MHQWYNKLLMGLRFIEKGRIDTVNLSLDYFSAFITYPLTKFLLLCYLYNFQRELEKFIAVKKQPPLEKFYHLLKNKCKENNKWMT